MTNHVNKGAQKSSVNQFGHDPNSAHEKSAKMEHFHKVHQEKEKKSKRTYTQKSTHSLCTVRLLFEHQIHTRYSN